MNIKYLLLFLISCLGFTKPLISQTTTTVTIEFAPQFDGQALVMEEQSYKISKTDSLKIEKFQFYISNVQLMDEETVVFREENSFHLIDNSDVEKLKFEFQIPQDLEYSTLQFSLGIDSLTNVSGAQGGALDPINGMYWAWQSGYINFKMEGVASNCPGRKNQFQYHLGGFQEYLNMQTVRLKTTADTHLTILFPIDDFFSEIDVTDTFQVMSPGEEAYNIAKLAASIFKIKDEE